MVLVTLSQFLRACGRVVPAFVGIVGTGAEELARTGGGHELDCMNLGYGRTIGSIAYESAPPPLRGLDKTDLNLDFTDNEARLFRVDLAF
jgi:hypothetical protein